MNVYFNSERSLLIGFVISLSFFYTFSQTKDIVFKTKNCYEVIGDESLLFEIWGHYPQNPFYFTLKLTYTLKPSTPNSKKITESRVYNLKRVDKKCTSSFVLGAKGLDFTLMTLDVFAYLSFDKMAEFHYEMHRDYKFDIPMLVDTYNNFGISVKFSREETEYAKATPRVSPAEINKSVTLPKLDSLAMCVINEFSRVVILTPKYDTTTPSGLLTRVYVDYMVQGKKVDSATYTAFSCRAPGVQRQSTLFVHQMERGFNINFQAKITGVGPMIDENKQTFSVPNAPFFPIHMLKPEHAKRQKIYMMNPVVLEKKCGDTQRIIYKTATGVPYFAKEYKKFKVRQGSSRYFWVVKDPSAAC